MLRFALALLGATLATSVAAQIARIEIHPISSVTQSDQDFLNGKRDGKPVTLAGELRIPDGGKGRLPVVVLVHGSGGVGGNVAEWAGGFNAMGIATFVLDSFTGRGLVSTSADQGLLGRLAMTYDTYRALEVLEKNPRVDPQRIAAMGFSRGGQAVLYASVRRLISPRISPSTRAAARRSSQTTTCRAVRSVCSTVLPTITCRWRRAAGMSHG